MRTRRLIIPIAALAGLAIAGCADPAATAPVAAAVPAERTGTLGPVELHVTVDDTAVSVGEPVTLVIEVLAETGVDIDMPDLDPGDDAATFEVVDLVELSDVPEAGARRWRHTWTLRTFDSGELELPPVTVAFTDRRDAAAEPIELELSIDPIAINVTSLVDDVIAQAPQAAIGGDPGAAELIALSEAPIRETQGFEVVHPPFSPWPIIVAAIVYVFGSAAALAWILVSLLRNSGPVHVAPPVPAHVWARRELDALAREELIDGDRRHEFFFRLSGIVRLYIERRFGLTAPEQTTPEFIRSMRRHPVLSAAQQETLGGFLRSADMVKFARHHPPRDECESALATARVFVDETVPVEDGAGPAADVAPAAAEVAA